MWAELKGKHPLPMLPEEREHRKVVIVGDHCMLEGGKDTEKRRQ